MPNFNAIERFLMKSMSHREMYMDQVQEGEYKDAMDGLVSNGYASVVDGKRYAITQKGIGSLSTSGAILDKTMKSERL